MRKIISGLGLLLVTALVSGWHSPMESAFAVPPVAPKNPASPPPVLPTNPAAVKPQQALPKAVPPLSQLGKALFFDPTLSNPPGMACGSCHAPAAGFTYPDSNVNALLGPVPGNVPGRFGNRKPPTISYATFSPKGPVFSNTFQVFVGGQFWDGRAADLMSQVPGPLLNPNEMNDILHNVGSPALVVQKVAKGPNAKLFQQVYGANVFALPAQQVFVLIAQAVATWEASPEVSPFNSRYDAMLAGQAIFTPSEINGLRLVTGSVNGRPGGPPNKSATCVQCHGIPNSPAAGPDLWTFFSYANIGAPRNPNNPFYAETNAATNPLGYNPLGAAYVDLGLGGFLYPANNLPAGNSGVGSNGKGDFLAVNGKFKIPTLRNVDKRPHGTFVKAYTHNGAFKSLDQLVHFYNTRNLTTQPGEVIDFTQANPYSGLTGKPLWPTPEYAAAVTLQNPSGMPGQIGNLGLTPQEEADIVAFLRTLSDQ